MRQQGMPWSKQVAVALMLIGAAVGIVLWWAFVILNHEPPSPHDIRANGQDSPFDGLGPDIDEMDMPPDPSPDAADEDRRRTNPNDSISPGA
jgi:hypothetical protein